MQSSELQNLKREYKLNSAKHLQQMTGQGLPKSLPHRSPKFTSDILDVQHSQDQNVV